MHRLAILACLAGASAFAADTAAARALIWGGGTTPEAGAAAMKSFDAAAEQVKALLELSPGYPKLVKSASVAGLKPGFHVVLLGLCAVDDAVVPLGLLKSVEPKAYARPVSLESAATCPKPAKGWTVKPAESVSADGNTLTVHVALGDGGAWRILTSLRDAGGEWLDFKSLGDSECDGERGSSEPKAAADGAAVKVDVTCYSPGCTTLSEQAFTWRFEAKGKRLKQSKKAGKYVQGECD